MATIDEESASKFINALIKSVQTLCHGYLDFDTGIEIIGHINLSVDKGGSLDYILKEKVCKNNENSTLFISNSFHAQPKPEQPTKGKNTPQEAVVQRRPSSDSESGRVSSAISSISTALTGAKDSSSSSAGSRPQQNTAKRKALDDGSGHRPAKSVSHEPRHFRSRSRSSSPVDSKPDISAGFDNSNRNSSVDGSATMLPQTASVTSDSQSELDVNLEGSVLERVDDRSNSDLPERDDDDLDLEVTFIKEEFVEGERSACEYQGSSGSQQYGRTHQRASSDSMGEQPLFPVALHSNASATYVPGQDIGGLAQQYVGAMGGASQPQPGPSGMRGASVSQGPDEGTSNVTESRVKYAARMFEGWLQQTGRSPVTGVVSVEQLDSVLCSFYREVRKKDGSCLKEQGLRALRNRLGRYFSNLYGFPVRLTPTLFPASNRVLLQLMAKSPSRAIEVLTGEDCARLRGHKVLSMDTPWSLLRKVWFELQLHFGVRSWSPKEMWPEVFVFTSDGSGKEVVEINPVEIARACLKAEFHNMLVTRKMYARGGPFCPVRALKLYLSKRGESLSLHCVEGRAPFLLTPNPTWQPDSHMEWYSAAELSVNKGRIFMRELSDEAQLSRQYTNMSVCSEEYTRYEYDSFWPQ